MLERIRVVTTVTPMKRGLKDGETDESKELWNVTTVTPMKRGLKVSALNTNLYPDRACYNRYPDEKGTER